MAFERQHILVAPMDWGLGHASRCVPVIRTLLQMNHRVSLGVSGLSGLWLRSEFPDLPFFEFPSYNISYSERWPMAVQMLRKSPGILRTIEAEHKRLSEILQQQKIDLIISDNRYGLWNSNVHSIILCHQIQIKAGTLSFTEPLLLRVHREYLSRFDECWIPDWEGEINLSGSLSHFSPRLPDSTFIGPLSRFSSADSTDNPKYEVAVVLSGPEPFRTQWEEELTGQLSGFSHPAVLIRGIEQPQPKITSSNVEIVGLAGSSRLFEILSQSRTIVSRSGYSSVMDWVAMNKPAVLVPTPGQTEQEYLAHHLRSSGYFYSVSQKEFKLEDALRQVDSYRPPQVKAHSLLLHLRRVLEGF